MPEYGGIFVPSFCDNTKDFILLANNAWYVNWYSKALNWVSSSAFLVQPLAHSPFWFSSGQSKGFLISTTLYPSPNYEFRRKMNKDLLKFNWAW